jgi:tetratricopeptide (TPR) repeat protein
MIRRRVFSLLLAACLISSCSVIPGLGPTAQSEFDEGLALYNQGKYQEAVTRFQKSIELDPNFGRAYLYLGRAYIGLGSWGSALSALRRAYQLVPGETKSEAVSILIDALFGYGKSALASGDFLSAIDSFREILGLQPTSAAARSDLVSALVGQGGALLAQGSFAQAISTYTEAVKLMPNNFDALFGLAKAFFRNGDYLKALQSAEDAMRFDSGNRELQSLLQELRRR